MPDHKSQEWNNWIVDQLMQPLRVVPRFDNLSKQAQSTLAMLEQVKYFQNKLDPKAFGVCVSQYDANGYRCAGCISFS